jgi:hypothetical protein
MGLKETQQMYIRTCVDRSVIVALSAEPPGVNELCVCVSGARSAKCADYDPQIPRNYQIQPACIKSSVS